MPLADLRELENLGYNLGKSIVYAVKKLTRGEASNMEWGAKLESVSETQALSILEEFARIHDYEFHFITIPYISKSIDFRGGFDRLEQKVIGRGGKKIACIYERSPVQCSLSY